MGVKNNTKFVRMQKEYLRRCSKLRYYETELKEEERFRGIYFKELNKLKMNNPKPSQTTINQFNSKFIRGKNDHMITFYTRKINNIQKL